MSTERTKRSGFGERFPRRSPSKSSFVNRHSSISGFTLLELLASISILGIIVVMMAQIFSESDRAWNSGTGRSVNNTEGRAALNMLMRDLQLAVADDVFTFKMAPDRNSLKTYGFSDSEINFVSLQNDSADGNRTAREIQYWVNEDSTRAGRYQLVRSEVSSAILNQRSSHCYGIQPPDRWYDQLFTGPAYAIVAENVVGLAFYAPDGSTTYESGNTGNPYANAPPYTCTNTPPYVDVLLEILNEREAKQLNDLERVASVTDQYRREFVERNARRHTARVYFQNRQGYRWR